MEIDGPGLWVTLTKDQAEITALERRQAIHTATGMINVWEEFGEDIKAQIIELLEKLSSHRGAYNNLLLGSLRYQLTKDLNFLKTIPDHIDGHPDDLTACASSFMSLANIVFNDTERSDVTSIINRRVFRSLFEKKLKRMMELYDLIAVKRSVPFSRNDKVVVLTRQFLVPPHAPTVVAIDFAIALIEDFGNDRWCADAEDHFRPKRINGNDPLCRCVVTKGSVATHEERNRMPFEFYIFKTASEVFRRIPYIPRGDRTVSCFGNLR